MASQDAQNEPCLTNIGVERETLSSTPPRNDGTPEDKGRTSHLTSESVPRPTVELSSDSDDDEATINISNAPSSSNPSTLPLNLSSDQAPQPRCSDSRACSPANSSDSWLVPEDIHTDDDVRRYVREISRDALLTDKQKNRRRQAVHSARFRKRQRIEGTSSQPRLETQIEPEASHWVHPDTGEQLPGCEHYPRKCMLLADCCGKWVSCRHCHDQQVSDHTMDRFKTKRIRCLLCNTIQPVSNKCTNPQCATTFATYFCDICKLFDGTPGKSIYHCPYCGICRVGEGLGKDNFHCGKCGACVSLRFKGNHHCLDRSLDANCPICKQYLFTSTKPVVFMKCSHTMHAHCFDEYIKEYYTCPICVKPLTNMSEYYKEIEKAIQREIQPPELANQRAEILCNSCDKKCITQYRHLHLKCVHCNGYTTQLLRTFDVSEEEEKEGEEAGSSHQGSR